MSLFVEQAGLQTPFSFHILEEMPQRDIIDDHLKRRGMKKFSGKVTMFNVTVYEDRSVVAPTIIDAVERLKTTFAHRLASALGPEIRLR